MHSASAGCQRRAAACMHACNMHACAWGLPQCLYRRARVSRSGRLPREGAGRRRNKHASHAFATSPPLGVRATAMPTVRLCSAPPPAISPPLPPFQPHPNPTLTPNQPRPPPPCVCACACCRCCTAAPAPSWRSTRARAWWCCRRDQREGASSQQCVMLFHMPQWLEWYMPFALDDVRAALPLVGQPLP